MVLSLFVGEQAPAPPRRDPLLVRPYDMEVVMRARSFFYVSLGVLALALAFHLGARSAVAQAGGQITGFSTSSITQCSGTFYVVTSNGDVFGRVMVGELCGGANGSLQYIGNFWGGPTPVQQDSWGGVKARYR